MLRQVSILTIALLTPLLIAGCGNSTITVTVVGLNQVTGVPQTQSSATVASDSTGIAAFESLAAKDSKAQPRGQTVTVQDGDQHQGAPVCSFTVSKDGHSYQVSVYSGAYVSLSSCDAAHQQSFLDSMP
jgi:hypothetical protein